MADGLTVTVSGLDEMNRIVAQLETSMKVALGAALYIELQPVLDAAKELCPVKTGALQASGRVNKARVHSDGVSISIDFGVEPHLDYAQDQHENLTHHHQPGKSAKFVEIPLMEWITEGGPQYVMDRVEESIGREIF